MARGDVIYTELPESAQHEQSGTRPAIAVQTDLVTAPNPMLMVVPLTATLSALQFPFTFRVEPSKENGLSLPSVLLVFQLRAISKSRVIRTIGHLEANYLKRLDDEMRRLLQL